MPPKRQADAPYYSSGANANSHRQEYGSFKEVLLENAWIGYWDEEWEENWDERWPFSMDSPFHKEFGEGIPSYNTLVTKQSGLVRTFESKEGRVPDAKTAFWKPRFKNASGRRHDMTLVPVPSQENLWCWAYRFTETVNGQEENLFALLALEKTKSNLNGYWHEKYSYRLRHPVSIEKGYSDNNFLFIRTTPVLKKKDAGGDTPPGRTGEVHARSLPGQTPEVLRTAYANQAFDDADLEEMADDLGCMPVQDSDCDSPIHAGTTSKTRECNIPHGPYVPRQRSETLRPDTTLQKAPALHDDSRTYHPVSSIEPTDTQEEERMPTAAAHLDKSQPHTSSARPNSELRSQNGRVNPSGERLVQNPKRRRENGGDSTYDAQTMPPPRRPKQSKTTRFQSCDIDAPPGDSMQCRPIREGPSGDAYQRTVDNAPTLLDRIETDGLQASSSRIGSPKGRPLRRFTDSGESGARNTKATPDQRASKEVSPAYPPHQRQDSPMQRSPSEATAFYESGEQPREEMQANAAPMRSAPENPPLPIRTSPAAAPTIPSISPQNGVGFDVNRALFKLVVADGKSREYGMRFHGCDTVQHLFEKVAERIDDELGPGDVLRNLVFYADMFVPERCRPEMDVPRDHEPSFSSVVSRIKKILEVMEDQVEMVVEVFVTRNN